ncbi:TRAP transporter small permease [Mesorhizobium sp.]|uniref:TRAP transporter small permease n=1 Tax=Mesorhizobium sp. TaxID=1871066 RepID=UPI0011FA4030|nr:TRAP transporter small permease [Mesorhizobium sp.]TIO30675.1 MAG: TRAP transporter small permease [Mesorhizobium sp.]TIP12483.1 MAG: TRAP transporter small permease [Mesorhizobium sp.]
MDVNEESAAWPSGLLGWYVKVIRFLAGISMLAVVSIMIAQVIARYVFNASFIWAEEICRYLLIWQTFLFIGMAYHRGELVAVDVVPLMLRPHARLVLKAIVTIPILVFLCLMTINGYDYATRFGGQIVPAVDFIAMSLIGHGVGLSVFWVYVSVAVGSALLALHMIAAIVIEARDLRAGRADTGLDSIPGA